MAEYFDAGYIRKTILEPISLRAPITPTVAPESVTTTQITEEPVATEKVQAVALVPDKYHYLPWIIAGAAGVIAIIAIGTRKKK